MQGYGAGREQYDEFGLLHENAAEAGLAWDGPPAVRRETVRGPSGRDVSALVWGGGRPDVVLLHGGAQNAHTWDTVALALDRNLVAIDLPGHGRSDWRDDAVYTPGSMWEDVAAGIEMLAPDARWIVGMSLGGLTALAVRRNRAVLVPRLLLVDVTPGVNPAKTAQVAAFIRGPEEFSSFDEILARTMQFNPTRSESSLRRGVLHNAVALDDGRWTWRYDRRVLGTGETRGVPATEDALRAMDLGALWATIAEFDGELTLAKGELSPVVGDDDLAELERRRAGTRVVRFPDAGHSIQGDRPVELARLIAELAG
ncbi:MAG: alpha/beta hydrolase [Acidimicrobiia bacterium]|nr:alpha/beta hydrolase [Acidimicrobiia bacterium]